MGTRTIILPKRYKVIASPSFKTSLPFKIIGPDSLDLLYKSAGLNLKIYANADEYIINKKSFSKLAALKYLVVDVGLREREATEILKRAEKEGQVRYIVKLAESQGAFRIFESEQPGVNVEIESPLGEFAPGYLARTDYESEQWVPGLRRPQPIVNILEPPPLKVIETIKRLAEVNDGDVFDISLLGGLIFATKDENIVDRYLPQVIRGLDALGRILFGMYRHRERLEERYGKEDYSKLLDNIQTSFQNLGDLVMDLAQQKIETFIRGLVQTESEDQIMEM